ncbi:MAG TPA: carboxypeptidase-like regulatory domain-containing protein [Gemmatimonadales bacterium]|jgi:hypothetical protein
MKPGTRALWRVSLLASLGAAASCGGKGDGTTTGGPTGAPAATQLAIVTQPAGAVDGTSFTTQPVVQVRDASGALVAGSTVSVTASIASGTGMLSGSTTVAAVAGVAIFTNLKIAGTGNDQLTFTSSGLTAATSSSISVSAAGGGGGGGGGGTLLFSEAFEDNSLTSRGFYDNSAAFTTVTAEAHGGTRSLQVQFNSGATGTSWVGTRHKFTPTASVYLSYWVKYSTNWVGSGQNFHPHEFYFLTTDDGDFSGLADTHLTMYVEHNYQATGGFPQLGWQDGLNIDQTKVNVNLIGTTENRAASGCNGNADGIVGDCYDSGGGVYLNGKQLRTSQSYFLPTPGTGYKNDWHHVEAYFQLNSIVAGIGQTDGIARYWFDGTLVIEKTNAQFRTGAHATMLFNQLILAPYIGSPGSPVTQSAFYDDLMVKTAP